MKYIRKYKQSLTESNWFERFPVTALKQDIIYSVYLIIYSPKIQLVLS